MAEIAFPLALRVLLPSWIGFLTSSQMLITRMPNEPRFILSIAGLISFPICRPGARLERKWREKD